MRGNTANAGSHVEPALAVQYSYCQFAAITDSSAVW